MAVSWAIKSGKLVRQPCEDCGKIPSEAHHTDYSKPLDVRWLCRKCHLGLHGRMRRLSPRVVVKVDEETYLGISQRANELGITRVEALAVIVAESKRNRLAKSGAQENGR